MNLGPWQLIIIALVILVLFGRGRISEMMGDFGKGIKSFKQGMNDESGKDMMRLDKPADPAPQAPKTAETTAPAENANNETKA